MKFGVGQSVVRKEDFDLLRGAGRYASDYTAAATLHAVVLRSPHAHARFRITDLSQAQGMPGVRLILTGDDVADLGNLPCVFVPPNVKVEPPPYHILAREVVHHVGDAVAFVVADTRAQAADAAEAIEIEWDALPQVVGTAEALEKGAALVWPDRGSNLAFEGQHGDAVATEQAFAKAAHVVTLPLVNQRLVTNYLDTRAVTGEYDAATDRMTLTLGSQGSHHIRNILCQFILKIPPEKLRVVTPDVGGGFGTKLFTYREYALAAVAAKRLNRAVKWVGERTEHFLSCSQGRDNLTTAQLALDKGHRILALKVETIANIGAYFSSFSPYIPVGGGTMLPGVYHVPVCHLRVRGVFTNTVPVDAYRGAGRPEAAYVIERLMDTAAREVGIGPDELRRINFIAPSAMPYKTPTGRTYDTGEFAGHLAEAQKIADWRGFEQRAAASKKAGRLRGVGIATYIEACGMVGPDHPKITLEQDGGVTVLIGTQSNGQGHHTAYAQIVADRLDLPPEKVKVIQGDTDIIATGIGTGGSSSIPSGGVSLDGAAAQLADKLKKLAADHLEAGAGDLEFADGRIRVVGTDRSVMLADLARRAGAGSPELTGEHAFTPPGPTYPNGTHLAEVEIDPDTGATKIVNYVVVDDFGKTLNPLLLAGQIHGGAAQGIGQALLENTVYDADSGQLVSASLMDYALPRADDMPPEFVFETRNVPCKNNPMGLKGAGEAGTIGATPAVMNAVADALWRAYRIRHIDMPATPERLWDAMQEGRRMLAM